MKTEIKKIKLSAIKPNPDNPRQITKDKMEKLCKSVEGFLKMLEIRPIVYDENHIIMGGNMRYAALKKLGYKEVPETWLRCVTDFSEDEKNNLPYWTMVILVIGTWIYLLIVGMIYPLQIGELKYL